MKGLITLMFLCFLLSYTGCAKKDKATTYDIKGDILNAENLLIQLEDFSQVPFVVLDTARVAGHKFMMKGYAKEGMYRLRFPDADNAYLIIYHKKGSQLNIKFDLFQSGKYTVSGNDESEWIQHMTTDLSSETDTIKTLSHQLDTLDASIGDSLLAVYRAQIEERQERYKVKVKKYIEEQDNPSLAAYAMTFYGDVGQDIAYFIDKTSAWLKQDPKAGYIQQLHEELLSVRDRILAEQDNGLPVRSAAPEIALPSLYGGDTLKLSELKGHVVLLDFWASWCHPCRQSNPALVRLYKKYNARGLEIYSVSLDKDKEQWQNAVVKDGLIWRKHVSDLQMWHSPVLSTYRVNSIPATYLIDSKGVIVGRNLKHALLEEKLEELLPPLLVKDSTTQNLQHNTLP